MPGKPKMKFSPMSQAAVQQPGGALFDIRCSAIAKELKTVREKLFKLTIRISCCRPRASGASPSSLSDLR